MNKMMNLPKLMNKLQKIKRILKDQKDVHKRAEGSLRRTTRKATPNKKSSRKVTGKSNMKGECFLMAKRLSLIEQLFKVNYSSIHVIKC